ncbi:MAG: hypothetical protein ACK4M7_06245, partial [Burkholderiales bacterium]
MSLSDLGSVDSADSPASITAVMESDNSSEYIASLIHATWAFNCHPPIDNTIQAAIGDLAIRHWGT